MSETTLDFILVNGICTGISQQKQGDKISFLLNEMPPAKAGALYTLKNQHLFLAIKTEDFMKEEQELVKSLKANIDDANRYTPGQMLRFALQDLWKTDNEGYSSFEDFYKARMEKIRRDINKERDTKRF